MRLIMTLYLLFALMLTAVGCDKKEDEVSAAETKRRTVIVHLHEAAQRGEIGWIERMIAAGCDIDARDERGRTPLYTAAAHGQSDVVEFLISRGADIDAKDPNGLAALDAAASPVCRPDVAKLLVAAGADPGSALYRAGWRDQKEAAELLLDCGAKVVAGDTPDNEMLLCFAVRHGLRGLVEMLLDSGADVNAMDVRDGVTALTQAVIRTNKDVAMLLIARGADLNKAGPSGGPLHYATSMDVNMAELLLAHGADVKAPMVLHIAVARGDKAMVELFLAHGADANAMDDRGDTPLDEAIARGHRDLITLLRKHGAVSGQNQETGAGDLGRRCSFLHRRLDIVLHARCASIPVTNANACSPRSNACTQRPPFKTTVFHSQRNRCSARGL